MLLGKLPDSNSCTSAEQRRFCILIGNASLDGIDSLSHLLLFSLVDLLCFLNLHVLELSLPTSLINRFGKMVDSFQ